MAGALNVIDFVTSGAQLLPGLSTFRNPSSGSVDATYVRIVVGASEDRAYNFGGNTPGVSLWNPYGSAIGYTPGEKKNLLPANFVDIVVEPREEIGNAPAHYVSITNGGVDAICIAGVALSFVSDGTAGFSTNVAAACGAMWSNSRTPVMGTVIGERPSPKCVWIDRDGSNGIPHQGMAFHLPSFNTMNDTNLAKSYTENIDLMCKCKPRFHMYTQLRTEDSIAVFQHIPEFISNSNNRSLFGRDKDPSFIIGNLGVPGGKLQPDYMDVLHDRRRSSAAPHDARKAKKRNSPNCSPRRPLAEQLIISPHSYNSARELCEARNSFGHSFVSLSESLFCDMTDKSLYYTCNDKVTSCCFDTEQTSFRACQKDSMRPPITTVNGTTIGSSSLRTRQVNDMLVSHWTKGDKAFDSVQRW